MINRDENNLLDIKGLNGITKFYLSENIKYKILFVKNID